MSDEIKDETVTTVVHTETTNEHTAEQVAPVAPVKTEHTETTTTVTTDEVTPEVQVEA